MTTPLRREVVVPSSGGGYSVSVGAGVRSEIARIVGEIAPSRRCALITDDRVCAHWGDELHGLLGQGGIDTLVASFRPGEAQKTRGSWASLTDQLLEGGLDRGCCVVALGGGVVGDLAGFVAATYMRGIPCVQLPTTTLAMMDAAVGGKTGVDHPAGKNLVGAFHPPAAVLADPDFLATLDRRTLAQGFAEAVKHGILLDAAYADWLASAAGSLLAGRAADIVRAVARSIEIKAGVVGDDELDRGGRRILNFGHTVGHAIEVHSGFSVPHGDAVAAGMVAEARIGEELGVARPGTAARVGGLLRPFELCGYDPSLLRMERLAATLRLDKKARRGTVELIGVESVGRVGAGDSATMAVEAEEVVRIMRGWSSSGRSP